MLTLIFLFQKCQTSDIDDEKIMSQINNALGVSFGLEE